MPIFSVLIPAYNRANLFKKAIYSVAMQTFSSYEIIVIDNSNDNKVKKVLKTLDCDNSIIYRKIRNHGVIARSRNEGINLSRGKWIAFLDSDDFWFKNKLEIIYDEIRKSNKFDVFCNNEQIEFKDSAKLLSYGPYTNNFYKNLLINGNRLSTSASIVSKIFLTRKNIMFDENRNFITAEDYNFFLFLAKNGAKFKFINKILGGHTYFNNSASSNYYKHREAIFNVIKYHINFQQNFVLENKKKINLLKKIEVNFILMDVIYFLKKKKVLKIFMKITHGLFFYNFRFILLVFFKLYKLVINNFKNYQLNN
jgi:teichuronic acid biosynthesis glycosyltransferase TuaG